MATIHVTVLGLGPMGQALAAAFLKAGHPTTVWNRTPGRATSLLASGAKEAGTLDDAIGASRVIVTCVMNYDAVSATLRQARTDWEDRVLINLTSGEPVQARRMADWAGEHGITYLDGAILTPTPAIGTPAATVLYSGASEIFASVRETLASIGGSAVHLGEDPGQANAYDVALLDLFAISVHGVVHAFALAAAEGIPAQRLAPFATGIGSLLPEMITRFAHQIDAGEHPGERSTIASARSGINHIISTASGHGIDVGALTAARAVMDRSIADGHGHDGLSRLAATLRKS